MIRYNDNYFTWTKTYIISFIAMTKTQHFQTFGKQSRKKHNFRGLEEEEK